MARWKTEKEPTHEKLEKLCLAIAATLMTGYAVAEQPTPGYNTKIAENIMTPDSVETRLGTLKFKDGMPSAETSKLELAGSKGALTFKSEYYITEWSRSGQSKNPRFNGWYAEASWFLTGELALYRDGKFIRPNIRKENGAWEVAFRASSVDLNDKDIRGGVEQNLAVAVNWYSITHWRLMGNLIKVKAEDGPYGKQDPWILQFRAQYYF